MKSRLEVMSPYSARPRPNTGFVTTTPQATGMLRAPLSQVLLHTVVGLEWSQGSGGVTKSFSGAQTWQVCVGGPKEHVGAPMGASSLDLKLARCLINHTGCSDLLLSHLLSS